MKIITVQIAGSTHAIHVTNDDKADEIVTAYRDARERTAIALGRAVDVTVNVATPDAYDATTTISEFCLELRDQYRR